MTSKFMGAPAEDSWKQKYLTSLDRIEKKEKNWKDIEDLLRHGMSRVALAAQGVDESLDQHLGKLRKSIRRGSTYEGLESIVESISVSVKQLDEIRQEHAKGQNPQAAVIQHLLGAVTLPPEYEKKLAKLGKLATSLKPEDSPDKLIQATTALFNDALAKLLTTEESQQESKSWIKRFFGDGEESDISMEEMAPQPDDKAMESDSSMPNSGNSSNNVSVQTGMAEYSANQVLSTLLKKLPAAWLDPIQARELNKQLLLATNLVEIESVIDNIVKAVTPFDSQSTAEITEQSEANGKQDLSHQAEPLTSIDSFSQFAQTNSTDQDMLAISQFCLKLLETLQFPNEIQNAAIALRDRVVDGITQNEVSGVLKAIADLILATRHGLEKEKQELQHFLLQLTDRLADIDQGLGGATHQSVTSRQSSTLFNDKMKTQMSHLQSSVQQATELSQLKIVIQEKLDAIGNHLAENRNSEQERQQHLEEALSQTTQKVRNLEQESQLLKDKLSREHEQATHDVLTGLHNRLAYESQIAQEFKRWKRYDTPLTLLIFDVDLFKNINDKYGHRAGDKALRLIAKNLKKNLRESDFLARYGGEEFIVIMPETDVSNAMNVADKLREKVSEIQFHYQEEAVPITISCGAAQFRESDSQEDVFQRADQGLYQAKENGRNQCYNGDG